MSKFTKIRPEFVTFAPKELNPGVVYISMEYRTVLHMCCCGCGNKVVTPLAPGRWHLIYDGETISLRPSIGNWSFSCQSHYWINSNEIVWARQFTKSEIESVRAADRLAIKGYPHDAPEGGHTEGTGKNASWWRRILRFFR